VFVSLRSPHTGGPAVLFGIALSAVLAALFASTISGLALEWASSPDSSYGALLAGIAAIVAWHRRRQFTAAIGRPHPRRTTGFVILVAGLVTYLIGTVGADVFLSRISLVIIVAGLTWYVAGIECARLAAAPLAFLLLAIPLPTLVVNTVTLPLQLLASRMAENLLVLIGVPVFRDGNVLELRSTSLEVAQACSGLRSLISLSAVACVVAWAAERSWPRRLIVIASALPIAVALNGVRVAATGVACEMWGRQMATGGWHELAGWITFAVAIAVLLVFQRTLPRLRTPDATAPAEWAPSS
jgi:exosortase